MISLCLHRAFKSFNGSTARNLGYKKKERIIYAMKTTVQTISCGTKMPKRL